jgi:uncharacterized protein
MGLAPSGNGGNPGKSAVAKVPVPIDSQLQKIFRLRDQNVAKTRMGGFSNSRIFASIASEAVTWIFRDEMEQGSPMDDQRWYQDGLRFKCTQCGDCCTGAPGYVWVNGQEIEQLAALVGEADAEAFEQKYVRKIGIRRSLREFPNGDCVFFDTETRRCGVYEARPRQCRTWPFWDSNVRTEAAWEHTCKICPGSGQGKLYSIETIEAQRQVIHV